MRKRAGLLFVALSVLALAAPVRATVAVELVGEAAGNLITFRTYVTSDGGETDDAIFGAIDYPAALVAPYPAGSSQVSLSTIGTAAPRWTTGALICTTAFCVAFSQVNPNGPQTADLTYALIATTTFVVTSDLVPDLASFHWRTAPSSQQLDFFGVTTAPGMYITIMPEPAPAALIGIGLLALTVAARNRASDPRSKRKKKSLGS